MGRPDDIGEQRCIPVRRYGQAQAERTFNRGEQAARAGGELEVWNRVLAVFGPADVVDAIVYQHKGSTGDEIQYLSFRRERTGVSRPGELT